MKKLLVVAFLLVLCAWLQPCSAADFTPAQMKKMGVFLSNFTELGMSTVDHRDFLDPLHPENAIRFGIWHNYINNFKSRIGRCDSSCPYGSLRIDGKYVTESIQKYLGFKFDKHQSVNTDFITCHYDGKMYHFEGADGETNPYARVTSAQKITQGVISLNGELYNPEDPKEVMGTFRAEISPATWKGKESWHLINLESQLN